MGQGAEETERTMELLRKGDQEALAKLFSQYRDQLWRMVNFRLDRRLGGRVAPSDVLQEAYIDALQRIKHYVDGPSMPLFVWLRLVVAQRLVDVHRQHLGAQMRDARQEVSLDRHGPGLGTSCSLAANLLAQMTSPSQAAVREETGKRLEDALNTMDPIDREVLALRHFEELSNDETAEILGLQKAAASNRYVRALRRLKQILAAIPSFTDEEE